MKKMNKKMSILAALGFSAVALSGCGAQQIVRNLSFTAGQDNGHLVAGFDAKVTLGQGSLPDAKLPIYNPKAPAQMLGYIETNPDGTVGVRVDVTEATKLQTVDGSLLPNGREIPVVLPAGVSAIGIPVINSNSKVYIAVGSQNIMAGVAVTLLADNGSSSTDWLRILQSLPSNIFYPFQLNPNLKGTAGVFTGDKVGVGVFAVQTIGGGSSVPSNVPTLGTTFAPKVSIAGYAPKSGIVGLSGLASVNGNKPIPTTPEVFGVRTQYPRGYKAFLIKDALTEVRETKLD